MRKWRATGMETSTWCGPHGSGWLRERRFRQRFGQAGDGLAVEFKVNSYTTNTIPSTVALREGDFVVAWASGVGQDGSYTGVFGQRFAALATLDIDGDGSYGRSPMRCS